MKKLALALSSAVLLAAALAVPASASFDPHFRLVSKTVNSRGLGDGFNEKLLDPHRLQDKVGYDRGVCKEDPPVAFRCKVTFHLSGEIGGHGDISVAGKIFNGQPDLEVVGGTGAFAGASGTVTVEGSELGRKYGLLTFDLD
jgi:hypothetical protein